jgi:hypothetical protein
VPFRVLFEPPPLLYRERGKDLLRICAIQVDPAEVSFISVIIVVVVVRVDGAFRVWLTGPQVSIAVAELGVLALQDCRD